MCTSLSARTWMTSTQALGMASLEVAFMRANILGMWPSGGTWTAWTQTEKSTLSLIIYCTCTWSAREGCAVNRHTHAVVTVSNTSPYVRVRVCVCVCNEQIKTRRVLILHQVRWTESAGQTSPAELSKTLLAYEAPVRGIINPFMTTLLVV